MAIEPKTKGDGDKMTGGLIKLAQEDPSFHFSRDEETNQTVIEGMGELHLEIIVDRLRREFNVECDVGAPQVGVIVVGVGVCGGGGGARAADALRGGDWGVFFSAAGLGARSPRYPIIRPYIDPTPCPPPRPLPLPPTPTTAHTPPRR